MNYRVAAFAAVFLCALAPIAPRSVARAQTQAKMNASAYADYNKADAELNRVYKSLMRAQDATGAAKLKKAQRTWLLFRDAEMMFAGDAMRGGSAEPLVMYGAAARLTQARVKDLNTHLKIREER